MYNKSACGCTLISSNGKIKLELYNIMFVEDAYLFHATPRFNETAPQLQRIVQHDIQEWDQGLESTGGN